MTVASDFDASRQWLLGGRISVSTRGGMEGKKRRDVVN